MNDSHNLNKCPIRYTVKLIDFVGDFLRSGVSPFFMRASRGVAFMYSTYAVDFSCIHEKFRAGRKYLCEGCMAKYVFRKGAQGLQNGICHMHKLTDKKTVCQCCEGKVITL